MPSSWDPLMVSHIDAKFGGHRHCGSRDITVLVCCIISQDHVIKKYTNVMGRSTLRLATIPPSLVNIETVVVEV